MKTLILAVALGALSSLSLAQWQTGLVSGADYSDEWSPFVLPWLAFEGERWQVNPMSAAYRWQLAGTDLSTGIALDYAELFDETERGILLQQSFANFIGPFRVANSVQAQATDVQRWKTQHTLAAQLPLAGGLFGLETGINVYSSAWEETESTEASGLVGLQYLYAVDDWQGGVLANTNIPMTASEDAEYGLMLMVMKVW